MLSFVSAASGNPAPITRASAERVAKAQYTAMAAAASPVAAKAAGGGVSAADVGWPVLGVAVLAAAVAIPVVRRRRKEAD